jgi:hypothetical protein
MGGSVYFESESFALSQAGCENTRQVYDPVILDVPAIEAISVKDHKGWVQSLIPELVFNSAEEDLLGSGFITRT